MYYFILVMEFGSCLFLTLQLKHICCHVYLSLSERWCKEHEQPLAIQLLRAEASKGPTENRVQCVTKESRP